MNLFKLDNKQERTFFFLYKECISPVRSDCEVPLLAANCFALVFVWVLIVFKFLTPLEDKKVDNIDLDGDKEVVIVQVQGSAAAV